MKKERLQELAGIQLNEVNFVQLLNEVLKPRNLKKAEDAFIQTAKQILTHPESYGLTKEDVMGVHYSELVLAVANALMHRGGM